MSVLCTLPELCTYVYHEQSFIAGDTKHSPSAKLVPERICFLKPFRSERAIEFTCHKQSLFAGEV